MVADSELMTATERRPVVLLVDDEAEITANLAQILGRSGLDVHTAADGQQALDVCEKVDPDLVVSDVLMPVLDGREFLRQLRAAGRWTPVILLTQVGESFERAAALDEGADDYLNKPFDPQELISRSARCCAGTARAAPSWRAETGCAAGLWSWTGSAAGCSSTAPRSR